MRKHEAIAEIGLDEEQGIYVRPSSTSFEQIYRDASDIRWDGDRSRLISRRAKELTPLQWFQFIIAAAVNEYGVELKLTPETVWTHVPDYLKAEIEQVADR